MMTRTITACLLVMLLPVVAAAQTPKTNEQLTKDVEEMQKNLRTLTENVTKALGTVEENKTASAENARKLDRLTSQINDQLEAQRKILDRIDLLTQQQQEQLAAQQMILEAVTQKDSQGNDVLSLSANMERSEEFREDLRKVVNQSLNAEGDLTIRNRMPVDQTITINQKEYGLAPGEVLTLKVPVGTVTAKLPGQKITNWTLGAPDYTEKIDIVPDTDRTVVYRPVHVESSDSVYVSPPTEVYYAPPVPPVYYTPPTTWYIWPF